jgi:uncharacterized sulfatase
VLCFLATVHPEFAYGQTDGTDRPNILFILTDDQGPWSVGVDPQRHPQLLDTPNMDRIAEEGAYFTQAFTPSPVCSPARALLLTSRYSHELGITDWIHPRLEIGVGLDPDYVTWAEQLQQSGYQTGLVGKWHLGIPEKYHPTNHGYDYFMGFLSGGNSPENPTLEKDGETREFEGFTQNILTDHAIEFIERNEDRPFALSMHYRAPHAPWLPMPEEDWAPYRDLESPLLPDPDYPNLDTEWANRVTREYLASVESVDRNVGRLLDTLDELGLSENTVVIFTSDHGYNLGHQGLMYKGNAHWMLTELPPATDHVPARRRPNMFDRSIRVPMAVRWPGEVEAGLRIDETVSFLDWYPTLLAMTGTESSEDVTIRGTNFLPLLRGESVSDWENELYGDYSMHNGANVHMRMYRTENWKLVRDFLDHSRDELYNLAEDPEESNNLIGNSAPEVQDTIKRLDAKLLQKMRETDDPALILADQ